MIFLASRAAGQSSAPDSENSETWRPRVQAALDPARIGLAARFVPIPAGRFTMGSPPEEPGRFTDERPHEVTLRAGYEMQATEVTELQYALVTGQNPSHKSLGRHGLSTLACDERDHRRVGDLDVCVDDPVDQVSWEDAQRFIGRLNELQDEYRYRLPTEAEWEYAARAGSSARGPERCDWAEHIHTVASRAPNAWGLYDMHENVWEWTQDWYGPYPDGPAVDPAGPEKGVYRVFRGGSWGRVIGCPRSAQRHAVAPTFFNAALGFRLVRSRRR